MDANYILVYFGKDFSFFRLFQKKDFEVLL